MNMRCQGREFKGIEFEDWSVGISREKTFVWREKRIGKKRTCEGSSAEFHGFSYSADRHRYCCLDKIKIMSV